MGKRAKFILSVLFFIISCGFVLNAGAAELSFETPTPTGPGPILSGETFTPIIPEEMPEPFAPSLRGTIEAANFDTNAITAGGYLIPPDPIGAAGPGHVVNVVNVTIEWYTKTGVQQNSQSLASFFSSLSPVNLTFDPKVIYDQYAGRFMVVTLEQQDTANGAPANTSRILVAVSAGNDPNGTWYFQSINSVINISGSDYWADYPGFAVGNNAVYVTANMFSFGTNVYGGTRLWIIDKGLGTGGFYDGGSASIAVYDPIALSGLAPGYAMTMQPSHMFGTPQSNVGTFLVGYNGLSGGGVEYLQIIRVDDPLGASGGPSFSNQWVSAGDIDFTAAGMPDAPQLGVATQIETNDRRAHNAVWRYNPSNATYALWTTAQVVPPSGADAGEATVHWWEVNTSALSSLSITQQGNIGGDTYIANDAYTFMPSIMVDKNGCASLGFAASASSIYGGAYYTSRFPTDPAGYMQSEGVLAAGTDYYVRTFSGSRNRWGDYSGIALDPNDEETFWVYNEYAMTRGTPTNSPPQDGRWATRWGPFKCDQSAGISYPVTFTTSVPANTLTVNVDASVGCTSSCPTFSYNWDWGDGTINGSGDPASHTYASAGTKTITLTVSIAAGTVGSVTRSVTIPNPDLPPTANASCTWSWNIWYASITDFSTDDGPDGDALNDADPSLTISIDWGDGSAKSNGVDGNTFYHFYTRPGTFSVSLKAVDSRLQSSTYTCMTIAPAYFTISGSVIKSAARGGGLLTYATAQLLNSFGTVIKSVSTGTTGLFSFGSLKPGTYKIQAKKTGYTFPAATTIVVGPTSSGNVIQALTP